MHRLLNHRLSLSLSLSLRVCVRVRLLGSEITECYCREASIRRQGSDSCNQHQLVYNL